jgi:seryl-tRNA synthetase
MLDIALLREQPEQVKAQLSRLFDPEAVARVDTIVELDQQRRALLGESEALQASRNKLNKNVGRLRGDKKLDEATRGAIAQQAAHAIAAGEYDAAVEVLTGGAQAAIAEKIEPQAALDALMDALRGIGERVNGLNDRLRAVEAELDENMLWLPNLPHESVPSGETDEANIAHEPRGTMRQFDFTPRAHWDLGPQLGIIDFERGVKLAGTRAYILRGWGSRLQRALEALFLDQARAQGFEEVYLPFFVREPMMYGAGQFPKFRDVVYFDPDADVYMLPTAEVAITNMFRDEILDEDELPLYFVASTPCFRRERASAGRDTRGIKRVHQFQKVEMYKFTTPETSYAELETLVEAACELCALLEIPYRRVEIVTGDLGFSASKKYDVEMWAPGSEEWLEVSSCSNTEAFQARRANVKYRPREGKRTQFVHTLNGSGLALPRVIIAILENYQRADGSVVVPKALLPYMGGVEVISGP